jgi:hypothetical protein
MKLITDHATVSIQAENLGEASALLEIYQTWTEPLERKTSPEKKDGRSKKKPWLSCTDCQKEVQGHAALAMHRKTHASSI